MNEKKGGYPLSRLLVRTVLPAVILLLNCRALPALEAEEILVVVNRRSVESQWLGRYYCRQRGVPLKNIFAIACEPREVISNQAFKKDIRGPIREYLQEGGRSAQIRCLVTTIGVPLKIEYPKLRTGDTVKHRFLAVDSALALLLFNDEPPVRFPNPLYRSPAQLSAVNPGETPVVMVARIDAPTLDLARRMIDDSIKAEREGNRGKAYFDGRGAEAGPLSRAVNKSIAQAAGRMGRAGFITFFENTPHLFSDGECPEAIFYWGWYSLGNYVDAFTFKPGAIAVHVASSECWSLKRGNYWCKRLIEDGVAATLGPVDEPYVTAFPHPDLFLACLLEGRPLGECYFGSLPDLNWKMVLLGDPLYRPFRNHPLPGPSKPISNDQIDQKNS